jgi:acetyltransferase EpsM
MNQSQKLPLPVKVPLLNPNESEASLVAIHIKNAQPVSEGESICTLETTKTIAEVIADASGYMIWLNHDVGNLLQANEIIGYIAAKPDWKPPIEESNAASTDQTSRYPVIIPEGLRITRPALLLAQQHSLPIEQLPQNELVTEQVVRQILQTSKPLGFEPGSIETDPNTIIIYGGGGHAEALIELIRSLGKWHIVGIIDDVLKTGEEILGVSILGSGSALETLYQQGITQAVNAVGGIGNLSSRMNIFEKLTQAGFTCPPLIHPTAFVESSASITDGAQVMPLAYIGSQVKVGFGVLVNTGAIISHDCNLEDFANISPGAILAGGVIIKKGVLVGMGVTINLQITIGEGARIGNGATIKRDVPPGTIIHAGAIWPL